MRTGYRLCWIQVALDIGVLDIGFAGYRVFAIYSFMFVPSCFCYRSDTDWLLQSERVYLEIAVGRTLSSRF